MLTTHIDTLREWFDNAEDGDIYEGDTFIRHLPEVGRFVVGVAEEVLGAHPDYRILARAPKPKPAWHDAVAVVATVPNEYGEDERGVWIPGSHGMWEDDMGRMFDSADLRDATPLIEAKVTDAMIDRILDVIDARFDNYPAGIGEELAVAALGLEAS